MMAFTISRKYCTLQRASQDLQMIGLVDNIQEWMEAYRKAIIAEAIGIERRNARRITDEHHCGICEVVARTSRAAA